MTNLNINYSALRTQHEQTMVASARKTNFKTVKVYS